MQKTILSTTDVARLFSVTETTVKRWADEGTLRCSRTPGGHRKFEMRYVVEFAEKSNLEPAGTLALSDRDGLSTATQVAILGHDFDALVRVFIEKALSPDRLDLSAYLSYLYEHRIQLWEMYDLIVQPGMREIGERWSRGEVTVHQEHRASYETLDALAKLQAEILVKPSSGLTAMFACLGEELHEIGLRCASYLFESEGWDIHYFGARTPIDSLGGAVHDVRPAAVCLSVTMSVRTADLERQLQRVCAATREAGGTLLIGGPAVPPHAVEKKCADETFADMRHLLGFIDRMTRARAQAAGVKH